MSYHDRIMSIPTDAEMPSTRIAQSHWKKGHGNARHAAAEIALEADEEIVKLQQWQESHRKIYDHWQDRFSVLWDKHNSAENNAEVATATREFLKDCDVEVDKRIKAAVERAGKSEAVVLAAKRVIDIATQVWSDIPLTTRLEIHNMKDAIEASE